MGNPPACQTPRFISSTRSRKCAVARADVAPGVDDGDDRLAGVVGAVVAHLRDARSVTERTQIGCAEPAVAAELFGGFALAVHEGLSRSLYDSANIRVIPLGNSSFCRMHRGYRRRTMITLSSRFDMQDALRHTRRGEPEPRGHGGRHLGRCGQDRSGISITVSRCSAIRVSSREDRSPGPARHRPHRVCPQSYLAGGLASSKTRLVTAIVPTMANQVFAQTVEAFREELLRPLPAHRGSQRIRRFARRPCSTRSSASAPMKSCSPASCTRRCCVDSWRPRAFRSSNVGITPTPIDMLVGFSHEKVRRWPSISLRRDAAASG